MSMRPHTRGFTLIEMLVSVAIFSIVMVMALGALLSLSEANRRAELLSAATSNFNSSLDSMSRSIRTGSVYHCGAGTLTTTADCAVNGSNQFAFLSAQSQTTVYKLGTTECANGLGCILRSQDGGTSYISITSPDIVVSVLKFYVIGSTAGDSVQPKVVMLASGSATIKAGQQTQFNVQTSITQRIYDQ
jgi:prepilin-type N-terminal cleavage/methylation domain-containing protein